MDFPTNLSMFGCTFEAFTGMTGAVKMPMLPSAAFTGMTGTVKMPMLPSEAFTGMTGAPKCLYAAKRDIQ